MLEMYKTEKGDLKKRAVLTYKYLTNSADTFCSSFLDKWFLRISQRRVQHISDCQTKVFWHEPFETDGQLIRRVHHLEWLQTPPSQMTV